MKTVKCVPISEVPENANFISSHVINKVKQEVIHALEMQSSIAPHVNRDVLWFEFNNNSATCPSTGIRIFLSFARIKRWIIVKIDFESFFPNRQGIA